MYGVTNGVASFQDGLAHRVGNLWVGSLNPMGDKAQNDSQTRN